jgi:cell shape-determining protein MreC
MKHAMTTNQQLFFAITYVLVAFVMLLDTQFRFQALHAPYQWALRPWMTLEQRMQELAQIPIEFVHSVSTAQKLIANLQIKNAELQVNVAEAQNVKKENEALRLEIEKRDGSSVQFESTIIAKPISIGSISYVDKGESDGVVVGNLVMAQGTLLGQVQKTDQFVSQVVTFDQGSWQTVAQTQNGVKGVVLGKNKRVLFTQVSADESLEVGDVVFTTGSVSGDVPSGLYIGQVTDILESVSAPVQTAVIEQGVKMESLPVMVIKKRE